MKKKTINLLLRIIISFAILGFLIYKIDIKPSTLKEIVADFRPLFYFLAIFIVFIHQSLWAFAWKTALKEKNIFIKQRDIFRAVITSYFFGTFLPTIIGADLVLTFNVGKSLPHKEHAPSSLMFIRILSMTASLLISGIALVFIANTFFLRQIRLITWLLLLAIWSCYWIATHPQARNITERIADKYKFLNFLHKIFDSFATFGSDKKLPVKIWLLGLTMALLKVAIDFTIALSLGIFIPYIYFVALIPSVSIIGLLPSIAGLGVREGAYVTLFSNMGIPGAKSFAVSLTVFSLNILLCLAGGILYLIHGSHVKSKNFN